MALLEAIRLHKRFGARVVLEDISLAFEAGKLTGIVGPNGAGKSTCFNVLTGMFPPDRGTILLDGENLAGLSPEAIAQRGISRSFQSMNVFDDFTALENVLLPNPRFAQRRLTMFGSARGARECEERSAQVLKQVGLAGREHVRAKHLAYGERRALEIGIALAANPKILFLDEPTAGLGREATARLRDLIANLKTTVTLAIIEHDLQFLYGLADRVAVIQWGQVIAQGTPGELLAYRWKSEAPSAASAR